MPRYCVTYDEVWTRTVLLQADNMEQLLEKLQCLDYDEEKATIRFEYSGLQQESVLDFEVSEVKE